MSEYSGKQSRGRMVGLVFAMQGAGLIVGPLVASILLGSGISDDYVRRILLALGAIPGLAVFYLRRQIHETPRFAMAGGAADEAEAAIAAAAGAKSVKGPARASWSWPGASACCGGSSARPAAGSCSTSLTTATPFRRRRSSSC
jgi:MFS family permease